MAEIKWIKITTDMFDNRKIKHLRKMPEGNNIVLIWVMLLTMAGRCNSGGLIFLTENIPYTPKMLADELGFEENTVLLALKALEEFLPKDNSPLCIFRMQRHLSMRRTRDVSPHRIRLSDTPRRHKAREFCRAFQQKADERPQQECICL